MVGVVSSILKGGNFIFADFGTPSMSILYKNARNVRFVLFRKNSSGINISFTEPNAGYYKQQNAEFYSFPPL